MKEHGYIFQAPLVRSILSGQKTMTRRPLYVVRKAGPSCSFDKRYPPLLSRLGPEGFRWTMGPARATRSTRGDRRSATRCGCARRSRRSKGKPSRGLRQTTPCDLPARHPPG